MGRVDEETRNRSKQTGDKMLIYIVHETNSSESGYFNDGVVNVFFLEEVAVLCVRMFNPVSRKRFAPFRYYDVFDTDTQRYISYYNLFPKQ